MYKMVIIDLDGTLLNDQKEVSKENAYMINRAYRENGTICVIATGRSYICAKHLADHVGEGLSQYIIASNGSVIQDIKNNLYLNTQYISNEIKELLGVFEPVINYKGKCIAIIHRINDDDDKLVVVPIDKEYSDDAIEALVEFQEKCFKHILIRK